MSSPDPAPSSHFSPQPAFVPLEQKERELLRKALVPGLEEAQGMLDWFRNGKKMGLRELSALTTIPESWLRRLGNATQEEAAPAAPNGRGSRLLKDPRNLRLLWIYFMLDRAPQELLDGHAHHTWGRLVEPQPPRQSDREILRQARNWLAGFRRIDFNEQIKEELLQEEQAKGAADFSKAGEEVKAAADFSNGSEETNSVPEALNPFPRNWKWELTRPSRSDVQRKFGVNWREAERMARWLGYKWPGEESSRWREVGRPVVRKKVLRRRRRMGRRLPKVLRDYGFRKRTGEALTQEETLAQEDSFAPGQQESSAQAPDANAGGA